jgi:RHS repeat-associated protein
MGNAIQRYNYDNDSFGNIQYTFPIWFIQPYTYTAREYDTETGLYFYRARYYDPKAGRFITKDPIGFAGGDYNLYVYAGNNPLSAIDPSGMELISLQEGIKIVNDANTWIDVPYGSSNSRNGIDCSHLVYQVYNESSFPYPYAQTKNFPPSDKFKSVSSPQEGDVILYSKHMGIYTGGKIISAQSGAGKVMLGEISWFKSFVGYYRYDKTCTD